jgi:cytosine/adenosine deaminase-related metal-dependent hydrolase
MHCAESPSDLEAFRSAYDMTPGQFCIATKLAGPKTVLAHMVNIDKLELDLPILQSYEVSVAHCPNSNLKLASGIASIPEMLNAGVNVTLGTDGAPCGNTYDMFREMHLAGILHKGNKKDASIVGAEDVLEMATINGAKALNIDREVGSIENGKKADFILINPHGLQCAPFDEDQILDGGLDPVTTVVYSCTGRDVETVVVNGEVLVSHGELVKQDEREIIDAAKLSIKGIRERAAITIENGGTWSIL